jgi:hypothetical protein
VRVVLWCMGFLNVVCGQQQWTLSATDANLTPAVLCCPPPQTVVMEYCDKGSLRHAMKRGVFHKRLGSTSVAVDLCAIVQVGVGGGGVDTAGVHFIEWGGVFWGFRVHQVH